MFGLATSLLVRAGIGARAAKILGPSLLILIVIGVIWLFADRSLDRAYEKGVNDTDALWNQASERLEDQAEQSEDRADANAAVRANEFAERLEEEKERIDDAVDNGSSPLDVLFPGRVQ